MYKVNARRIAVGFGKDRRKDLNNREWIKDTLSHKENIGVPYNFYFSPVSLRSIEEYYGEGIEDVLDLPLRSNGTVSIKPLYADPDVFGDFAPDEFGVKWSTNKIDRGSPIPCLIEPSLKGYSFPDPNTDYRFVGLDMWCENNVNNFSMIWIGDLWERAVFMRGMENLLLDLHLNPDFVHELLRNLADYILETMKILFERFEFDAVNLSDDYGMQNSMIMSPDHWREFVKPYLTEIYSFAKTNDRTVFHHSCGNVYPIIPDLIDIGLDILHPIQPEAMDIYSLKREFGKDLTLNGGVNTQRLLPFGTESEIRDEIRRLKDEMGKGGGYILEPGITILADVPQKNIVAMIDEAMK